MDDHLLLAAEEPEVAVLVGAGEVAGVQPLVAHDLLGRLRRFPVAGHAAAGADPDAADRFRPDRLAVFVADRDAEAADRRPDRALLDDPGGRVERRQADLGHPVALDDREAGGGGELVQQLGRDLVGAGPADPQRGEVARLQVVVAHQRRERGRDHRQHRRLVLAQQRQQLVASVLRATTTSAADRERRSAPRGRSRCATSRSRAGRRRSASSSKAAAALAIIQRSDSRVWVTPFAGPVLPEVKKIAAGLVGVGRRLLGRKRIAAEERLEAVVPVAGAPLPRSAPSA